MQHRLKELLELLLERFRVLPPAKLFVVLGLIGAAVAVGMVSLLWVSNGETQQVLYTQLSLEDAADLTAKLREMRIPYTSEGNGTTILVPSSTVYETRLRLASEGLPQGGGVGFELFDQRGFGMTEFMQKLNYRRALQGELARTVMQLGAVKSARVHIALPEKTLFLEHQEKPSASVVLKLTPGRPLSQDQVRGISYLVSSSVEGLKPDDVTVLDTSGHILSRSEETTSFLSRSEVQLKHQRNLEQNLERRVQTLLEPAVGEGKAIVRVSATLDFQHIERTEERFDSDYPAIRSEQRNKEQGRGAGPSAISVPGVRSNTDTSLKEVGRSGDPPSLVRESETVNYEISKMVSKVVVPSGEIKRLSVAVLMDGTYQSGGKDGEQGYVARTSEELAQYADIIKSAVGFNESRGDRVEVANVPFQPKVERRDVLEMSDEAQHAFWLDIGRYGAYVILGFLFFLFVVRPLVRWATDSGSMVAVESQLPRTVQELEADLGGTVMRPESEEGQKFRELKIKPTGQELRTQLAEFVRSEPERAVEVLRMWLRG